jgi:hypothetical protein
VTLCAPWRVLSAWLANAWAECFMRRDAFGARHQLIVVVVCMAGTTVLPSMCECWEGVFVGWVLHRQGAC